MSSYPDVLTKKEAVDLLVEAETLWRELQQNELGGYSGINRPYWILYHFKRMIEKYGRRDIGLTWSKDDLERGSK